MTAYHSRWMGTCQVARSKGDMDHFSPPAVPCASQGVPPCPTTNRRSKRIGNWSPATTLTKSRTSPKSMECLQAKHPQSSRDTARRERSWMLAWPPEGRDCMPRYELMPMADNTWSVIDNSTSLPAQLSGKRLQGLSLEDAQQALFSINVGLLRSIADRSTRPWERRK